MIHFDLTAEFKLTPSNYSSHPLDGGGLWMMGAGWTTLEWNVYRIELIGCLFDERLGARMPIKSIHQMGDFD